MNNMFRYILLEKFEFYFMPVKSSTEDFDIMVIVAGNENPIHFKYLKSNVINNEWIEGSLSLRELLSEYGEDIEIVMELRGQTLIVDRRDFVIPYNSNEKIYVYGKNREYYEYIDKDDIPHNLENYKKKSSGIIFIKPVTDESHMRDVHVVYNDGTEKFFTCTEKEDEERISIHNFVEELGENCTHILLTAREGVAVYHLATTRLIRATFGTDTIGKIIVYKAPYIHHLDSLKPAVTTAGFTNI